MACFIVPAAEAVITSAAKKIIKHHEEKLGSLNKMHPVIVKDPNGVIKNALKSKKER